MDNIRKWKSIENCPRNTIVDLWIVGDSTIIDHYCRNVNIMYAKKKEQEQGRTSGWVLCSDGKFRNRCGLGEELSYKVTPLYFIQIGSPPQLWDQSNNE